MFEEKGVLCSGLKVIVEGGEGVIIFGIFLLIFGYSVVLVCVLCLIGEIV